MPNPVVPPLSAKANVTFTVNGAIQTIETHTMARLIDVLRENLKLTGTKEGCGEGECGACAVMINGELINSCLVPMTQMEGATILTIEGLAPNDKTLHDLQQAFLECGGAQCGICTPGMIMACHALLSKNPVPTLADIQDGLAGNLCRCTGYTKIFAAVSRVVTKSTDAALAPAVDGAFFSPQVEAL